MSAKDKIIIALDFPSRREAVEMVNILGESCSFYKIGLELFIAEGPSIVRELKDMGKDIFLDLKLNDIPNTVGRASYIIGRMGIRMFNVHAFGGREMMKAAKEQSEKGAMDAGEKPPIVLAVTVLTSISSDILVDEIRILSTAENQAIHLSRLAEDSNLDGVVCSPLEIGLIKDACGKNFITVSPGIRLEESKEDDQKRIATPKMAIESGGDYIVIGRPVTRSEKPKDTLNKIIESIEKI